MPNTSAEANNADTEQNRNSEDNINTNQVIQLFKESESKIITSEIGWARYVSISFASGNLDDYTVYIDGKDISPALTAVDDEKTIVKWRSTITRPSELKVVRKSDGVSQVKKIGESIGESVSAGDPKDAPAYLLVNARIPRFDYYINNYDREGNIREDIKNTTFDLSSSRENIISENLPSKFYIPDADIDDAGNGTVTIKLSLKNEAQKAWFEQLKAIKALSLDYQLLNENLVFGKTIETQYGNTGVISFILPQSNLRSRGRYFFNLSSNASKETLTLPVHLVSSEEFKMELHSSTANPRVGERMSFNIIGEAGSTFGNDIGSGVKDVELIKPSGKILKLEKIKDWSVIGDLFTIYGKREAKDENPEKIITDEIGVYTIKIYADGYKLISKQIDVAPNAQNSSFSGTFSAANVDAVSSATKGGLGNIDRNKGEISGGISGGGTGGYMNGYYLFNHDLLVNAIILNEIGRGNEASFAVLQRWFDSTTVDAAMNESMQPLFKFSSYLNTVRDKRLEGVELSFASYCEQNPGAVLNSSPRAIKPVLEDGLLGATRAFNDTVGLTPPEIGEITVNRGEDVHISPGDSEYISKIQRLIMDGNAEVLSSAESKKQFEINDEKTMLTLHPSAFREHYPPLIGRHVLRIEAAGYKVQEVVIIINENREDITPALADNPLAKEGEDKKSYHIGQDVIIKASSERTDDPRFGHFISAIRGIQLETPDGTMKTIFAKEVSGTSGNTYYETANGNIIIKNGNFQSAGSYVLHIIAYGYDNRSVAFEVMEGSTSDNTNPGNSEEEIKDKKAPAVHKVRKSKGFMLWNPYYQISFKGYEEAEISAYVKSGDKKITVNGKELTYVWTLTNDTMSYTISGNEIGENGESTGGGGKERFINISEDTLDREINTVSLEVPGYTRLEVNLDKEGNIVGADSDSSVEENYKAPIIQKAEYLPEDRDNNIPARYALKLKTADASYTLAQYFGSNDFEIKINDIVYTASEESLSAQTPEHSYYFDESESSLVINAKALKDKDLISIRAEKYEDFEHNVHIEEEETPPGNVPKESPNVESWNYGKLSDKRYYEIIFEEGENISEFINSPSAEVKVNDTLLQKTERLDASDTYAYEVDDQGKIRFTADAFSLEENQISIIAQGYTDCNYILEKLPAITISSTEEIEGSFFKPKRLKIVFDLSSGLFAEDYYKILDKDRSGELVLEVNGTKLERAGGFMFADGNNYAMASAGAYGPVTGIEIPVSVFDAGEENTLSIKIPGYKDLDLTISF